MQNITCSGCGTTRQTEYTGAVPADYVCLTCFVRCMQSLEEDDDPSDEIDTPDEDAGGECECCGAYLALATGRTLCSVCKTFEVEADHA